MINDLDYSQYSFLEECFATKESHQRDLAKNSPKEFDLVAGARTVAKRMLLEVVWLLPGKSCKARFALYHSDLASLMCMTALPMCTIPTVLFTGFVLSEAIRGLLKHG